MHLVFDIFQGIGIASAAGIRPFLPALAVGGLAAGDVEIHFKGTNYAFLQHPPFLIAMAIAAIVCALIEWRFPVERGPGLVVLAVAGAAIGALLFAGSLCRGHYAVWPGIVGGVICALIALAATAPLLARVRTRLGEVAARPLPLYAEIVAVVFAALSVVAPPIGLIGLLLLVWLLVAGRARGDDKYAGLRILR
jgi:Domain of unknown function (DUF4126)